MVFIILILYFLIPHFCLLFLCVLLFLYNFVHYANLTDHSSSCCLTRSSWGCDTLLRRVRALLKEVVIPARYMYKLSLAVHHYTRPGAT